MHLKMTFMQKLGSRMTRANRVRDAEIDKYVVQRLEWIRKEARTDHCAKSWQNQGTLGD